MGADLSTTSQWVQYVCARVAAMGLSLVEAETNLQIAASIGQWMYRLDHKHRSRTLDSIHRSFPSWDRSRVAQVGRGAFEHLIRLAIEVCYTPRLIHADSWSQRVKLAGIAQPLSLLNTGKPIILVTGHVGNWEVLGYVLAVVGYQIHAIARPLNNPLINRWLLGIRERHGLRIITKWQAADQMQAVLNASGALAFIADQNAGSKGLFVPFFGRMASTYKSIGLLALRRKVPIVCGYARRLDAGYQFELGATDIIRPEDWVNQPDPLYYVTARYMRAIEMMIRQCPPQYLWMHRRWKSRPRYELQGKPMPGALRKKLESLPWMDQPTIDRLRQPA